LLKRAYRYLVLVRTLDNRMLSLQRQGRIGFYVPSTGEEASQVGSAMALEKRDWVFPAYREPGAALWRGYSVETLIAQAYGNAKDPQQGRQMPNHYGARDVNYVPVSSPVGTQIPQAVGAATKAAADKARSGGGPTMIEAVTYRMGPHSSSDDPTRYRSKEEVDAWAKRDPIERMRKYLELKGLWSKDSEEKLRAELEDLLQATIKEVERSPPPPIETLFTYVYAEMTPQPTAQMDAFLASGERRRPEMLDKFPL